MKVVLKDKITEEIVSGILQNDNKTIVMIYNKYLNSIRKLVNGFGKLKLDAEDVFQEGLSRTIVNIRNNKFKGESSFHSYFYAICRNICLKEIRKVQEKTGIPFDPAEEDTGEREWELINLVLELREKIDPQCKEIIDLRFNIDRSYTGSERLTPFEYIASILNIQADNARQRFRRCMVKFSQLFTNDPAYKEIITH
jgi:RNA polymerase sigma factor (sigma-70 family)